MKKNSVVNMVLVILFIFPAVVYSENWQGIVQQQTNGSVNWGNGVIQATGIGVPPEHSFGKPSARPMALRAARLVAYRNLLEIIQGVRIDSTTLVKNFAVEDDVVMSKIQGMIKGAQVVKREYLSDGTVEVTVQMNLQGGFSQLVLPGNIKPVDTIIPMTPPAAPAPVPSLSVFTGMVVDARGLNLRPAMSPKVYDESGQEVYGSAFVSREYAVQQGMSGYAKDVASATNNSRVTDNPLVIKGIKTKGPGNCDIVISNADASKLRSAAEHLSFMKQCRVMMVVD